MTARTVRSGVAVAGALATVLTLVGTANLTTAVQGDRSSVPSLAPTSTPDAAGWVQLRAGITDYAPAGLPDFDQRQGVWKVSDPLRTAWTHDGPLAAVAALWWLDSLFDTESLPPPAIHDGFDLLRAHGAWDDHDPRNVAQLVALMAAQAGTNGPQRRLAIGTCLDDLAAAVDIVLGASREPQRFAARVVDQPTLQQLRDPISAGQPVVLLVGIWQYHELLGWRRLGGHYVGLAAVDATIGRVRVADPFQDVAHSSETTTEFNDASRVSHDPYTVTASLGPVPALRLDGYLEAMGDMETFITNFQGLNGRHCGEVDTDWLEDATVEGHIDAALSIAPSVRPTATLAPGASVGPSSTAGATATITGTATLTATATPTATATSTMTATAPSTTATATSTATDTPSPSPCATPTATTRPTATVTASPVPPSSTPSASATAAPTTTPMATATPSATLTPVPETPPPPAPTPPTGNLCGRVSRFGTDAALAAAAVSLLDDGEAVRLTTTGTEGQYCLFDVASAMYVVQAEHVGCRSSARFVDIAGGTVRADLALRCAATPLSLPVLLVSRQRGRTR